VGNRFEEFTNKVCDWLMPVLFWALVLPIGVMAIVGLWALMFLALFGFRC
jgi:hypothetical protein